VLCIIVQDVERTSDWFQRSLTDFVYVVDSLQHATVPQTLHVCLHFY